VLKWAVTWLGLRTFPGGWEANGEMRSYSKELFGKRHGKLILLVSGGSLNGSVAMVLETRSAWAWGP